MASGAGSVWTPRFTRLIRVRSVRSPRGPMLSTSASRSSSVSRTVGVRSVSCGPGRRDAFLISTRYSGSSPATGRSGMKERTTRMRLPVSITKTQQTTSTAAKAKAKRYSSQVPTTRPAT